MPSPLKPFDPGGYQHYNLSLTKLSMCESPLNQISEPPGYRDMGKGVEYCQGARIATPCGMQGSRLPTNVTYNTDVTDTLLHEQSGDTASDGLWDAATTSWGGDSFYLLDDFNYTLVLIPSEEYVNILSASTLWTHTILHASLNLYGGRAHFTKKEILYQFLGEAGLDEGVLVRMIRENVRGMPKGVTEKSVRAYWRDIGPDSTKLLSSITKLRQVERDYDIPIKDLLPNQSITIDQFFSQISMVKNSSGRAETIPALNGDTKVLIAVDTKSGSVRQYTRKRFKNPENLLENIIDDYGTLLEIWTDDSFVTIESLAMCKRRRVKLLQFVPGQHNIYGGRVEGIGRWVKEGAQTCWNKILQVIKQGGIDKLKAKRLWRHCWIFAVQVINLRPSLHDKSIMRFFFVYGRNFSLINDCMMPFMTPLIVHKLLPTDTGRGAQVYYLCRSITVGTGIVVYDPITEATSVVAPFKVYTHDANKGTSAELTEVATELHGRFAPVPGVTATAAIPLSPTLGLPLGAPIGVAGGGSGISAVQKTVQDSQVTEHRGPTKRSINKAKEDKANAAKAATADALRGKAVSDRDRRRAQHTIVAEAAIRAKDTVLLAQLRIDDDLAAHAASDELFKARSNPVMLEFGSEDHGDTRDVSASPTHELNTLSSTQSSTNSTSLFTDEASARKAGSVIFDTDPDGVHSREDEAVLEAFSRSQMLTCILGEEIEYSEKRVYLEDLIGDYNVLRNLQDAKEVEEARLDITDPNQRPPKPTPPGPSARKLDVRWQKAMRREIDKIMQYDVMVELPKDDRGKYVYPKDAIVQRILDVAEYKWKKDPDTGIDCWLECIRLVADGSMDLRPDNFYALTPDRTILFVLLAIVASLGHPSDTADVERAYLNAFSLDKNLVIIAGDHMFPLPRASLLIMALYGTKRAALGWEVKADAIMESLDYKRMRIARGIYLKFHQETGALIRAYRHSDDFYLTSPDQIINSQQGDLIRGKIGMSPFVVPTRFLGLECERIHHITGLPDTLGKLILLRQTAKIEQAEVLFELAFEKYFPRKDRQVSTPVPLDYNIDVSLLSPLMARPCDKKEKLLMQSIVGTEIWLTSSVCRWGTFATYVSASSTSTPIIRDLYNALYHLKFIIQEKHTPLVLGGDFPIDIRGTSDCSLGTGRKGKSVITWNASLNEKAGAVGAFTTSTNFALCNISHGETESMVKCTHLQVYIRNVLEELGYLSGDSKPVLVQGDNKASISFAHGGPVSNLSRHLNQRVMAIRNYCEEGVATYEHIPTELNTADLGTKAMGPGLFRMHARNLQGHRLLDSLPIKIRGYKEIAIPELDEDLVQLIDTLAIDSGMGSDFDTMVLAELLHMQEEEQFVNEINWTVNDYFLSNAYLFRLDVSSAEEQPVLMATDENGSVPALSEWINN